MKKVLFAVAVVVALGFSVTSCKSEAKKETEVVKIEAKKELEEVKTEKNDSYKESEKLDLAKMKYKCPMKCEGDKAYDVPGQCPTCKMDLKVEKVEL